MRYTWGILCFFSVLLVCGTRGIAIEVSSQNGQVADHITVDVPPWKAVQPNVVLVYGGNTNGVLGVGWGLMAGSYVVRGSKRGAIPQFSAELDAYYLDGKELVRAPAYNLFQSDYYFRDNNTVRIKVNGPNWEVTSPEGTKYYYSPLLKVGGSGGEVIRWGLTSVENAAGNAAQYTYVCDFEKEGLREVSDVCVDPLNAYLSRIRYREGTIEVKFDYDDGTRPDFSLFATGKGGFGKTRYRLVRILVSMRDSSSGTFQLRNGYEFTYALGNANSRSLLVSAQPLARASQSSVSRFLKLMGLSQ